jgi:hypothetical protein
MSTTETAESWLGRVPRTPRREQQPWRTPEDAAGWTRIHRGPGAGELPLIGVEVDLDRPESEWLRREAERTGLGYTEIVKRLVEEARRADERREARAKKRAGWPTTRPLRRRSRGRASRRGCNGGAPPSTGGRSGARSRARARSRPRRSVTTRPSCAKATSSTSRPTSSARRKAPANPLSSSAPSRTPISLPGNASTIARTSAVTAGVLPVCAVPWVRRTPDHTVLTAAAIVGEGWPAALCASAIAARCRAIVAALRWPPRPAT